MKSKRTHHLVENKRFALGSPRHLRQFFSPETGFVSPSRTPKRTEDEPGRGTGAENGTIPALSPASQQQLSNLSQFRYAPNLHPFHDKNVPQVVETRAV